MQRKGISLGKSSVALTLLSLSEFVTYVLASMLGDNLKGRLVYANVVSSSCLAVICIVWPFVDIDYALILAISLGHLLHLIISTFLRRMVGQTLEIFFKLRKRIICNIGLNQN